MTSDLRKDGSGEGGDVIPYEPPVLTPIGSLHDLLAGGGTQSCDSGGLDPNGGPIPFGTVPGCP
jgi:hypothetical protein